MSKQRTKTISIRVSTDEYELVKSEHTSRGVRSLSEFAREALQKIMCPPVTTVDTLQAEMRLLDRKVDTLQMEVIRLSRILTDNLVAKLKD